MCSTGKLLDRSKISNDLIFHELCPQVYALEKKYHAMHNPLYQQRAAITDVRIKEYQEECLTAL